MHGICRDPKQIGTPFLFPYHSHSRIPKDMGIVREAYHKGVPLFWVPEITLAIVIGCDRVKLPTWFSYSNSFQSSIVFWGHASHYCNRISWMTLWDTTNLKDVSIHDIIIDLYTSNVSRNHPYQPNHLSPPAWIPRHIIVMSRIRCHHSTNGRSQETASRLKSLAWRSTRPLKSINHLLIQHQNHKQLLKSSKNLWFNSKRSIVDIWITFQDIRNWLPNSNYIKDLAHQWLFGHQKTSNFLQSNQNHQFGLRKLTNRLTFDRSLVCMFTQSTRSVFDVKSATKATSTAAAPLRKPRVARESKSLRTKRITQRLGESSHLSKGLHPGRLTWNIIIGVWKIIFLSKWVICMFHVNLPGRRVATCHFS